jgi:hypothetical protein
MENIELSPGKKAKRTGQWAKIMTKWLITYTNAGKKWQLVSFDGKQGSESTGIVDFIAIRKNHNPDNYLKSNNHPLKSGDYFELILIQAKGGSASMPTTYDNLRLSKIGKYYHAKRIILSNWQKGKTLTLYRLVKNNTWEKITPKEAFS